VKLVKNHYLKEWVGARRELEFESLVHAEKEI